MRMTKGATECVVRPVPLRVVTVRKAGGVLASMRNVSVTLSRSVCMGV